jgi:hypothetical protein
MLFSCNSSLLAGLLPPLLLLLPLLDELSGLDSDAMPSALWTLPTGLSAIPQGVIILNGLRSAGTYDHSTARHCVMEAKGQLLLRRRRML